MLPIAKLSSLRRRFFSSLLAAAIGSPLLIQPALVRAQQPAAVANPARIAQPVDDAVLATLKGNVHPLARPQYDKGPANPSLPADRMQLVLKRSPGQEIALRQLLGSLQNPNSAQYRKWLAPEQFGAQYGVADADIQTVSAWLASQGFKINKVNKARTIIEFSGTVGKLQTAFHTQIHNYTVNGEQHLANAADPQIPAALAPVVAGLSRMNDFFPKPQHAKAQPGKFDKPTGKLVPELTTGSGTKSDPNVLWVVPGDAATIYDTPNSYNINFKTGTSYTGSNVTIGIVGYSNINVSTVNSYRSVFGLPAQPPTVVVDGNDPGTNGALDEAYLDLEISGGLAPNASQIYYVAASTNLDDGLALAIQRALDDNAVGILSASYGDCEAYNGSGNALYYGFWEEAAAQGITVTVSTGDSGAAGCDDPDTQEQAQNGLQVNGLASTPYNIAVGGTDYDVLPADFAKYVSTANSSTFESALGFIPEEPWNNSTAANGLFDANTPYSYQNSTNIQGAGGGASGCVNPVTVGNSIQCDAYNGGATTGYPKPSWQTGGSLNIPSDGVRDLPDVSLLSANGFYDALWLVCSDDVNSDGYTENCSTQSNGYFYFNGFGGTSTSAPAFAGILALVSQSQGGARLGQANYVLYNLANQSSLYSSVFHDVTVGNNSVYCVSGSLDCGGNLFETGYDAGVGYDLASGLGSVDVTQLINNWTTATFTPTTTAFTINGGTEPVSITHGQSVTFDATVAGAGGTPTGDVAIIGNANQQAGTENANAYGFLTLSGGTTGAVSYSNLPGGTYTISANYGGNIDYAESQSSGIQVTVGKEDSVLNLFAENGVGASYAIPSTSPYGTYFSLDAQPIGVNEASLTNPPAATGTVDFSDTAGFSPFVLTTVNLNSNGYAELPLYYWSTGSHSVTASYSGDNSLNPSAAPAAIAFAITQAPTVSTVSAAPASGGAFTVTTVITPNPLSFANAPTGMVTLAANGTTLGSGFVSPAADSNGNSLATATITANLSSLPTGATSIAAAYSGDANYLGSSGTLALTPAFAFNPAPGVATVSSPGQSGTSTISVASEFGYAGTVNLACALTTSPSGAVAAYNPTCSLSPASVPITSTAAGTATATFATAAATTGALAYPATNRWHAAAGGAALACVLFFGIPARRRSWRAMLGLMVFLVAIAGVGCGGGHVATNPGTPGTTTGTYTFTVTGTDSVTSTITQTTTVTVTVN